MQLLGLLKLDAYIKAHSDARGALNAWRAEVEKALWSNPQDIKNAYSSASFLAGNKVIFNIKGNKHRLVVKVRYQSGMVLIEWIGTHADYSKQSF